MPDRRRSHTNNLPPLVLVVLVSAAVAYVAGLVQLHVREGT
jgi:hypothetical protein